MKKRIRLTESDLHRIVKEYVKRMLNEEIKTQSTINYPGNAFFFKYRDLNGVEHDKPAEGTTGYETKDECLQAMAEFLYSHKEEIEEINGPFIGVYD